MVGGGRKKGYFRRNKFVENPTKNDGLRIIILNEINRKLTLDIIRLRNQYIYELETAGFIRGKGKKKEKKKLIIE